MKKIFDRMIQQLAALQLRTAYALIALGFVIGIVLMLNISDAVAVARAERDVIEKRLAQYGNGLDLELWQQRAAQTNELQSEWQTLFWRGPAPGIIATQIQGKIAAIASQSFLENVRYGADPIVVDVDGQSMIRFQLNARSSNGVDVINALGKLAGSTPALIIKDLSVNVRPDDTTIFVLSGLAPIIVLDETSQLTEGQ